MAGKPWQRRRAKPASPPRLVFVWAFEAEPVFRAEGLESGGDVQRLFAWFGRDPRLDAIATELLPRALVRRDEQGPS